ncbi:hypothetical protein KVX96_07525 [Pseudoruegeria sp. SHC-113]|nr:hypothetical protein [Pseudoruegeria sp. SHC-113]
MQVAIHLGAHSTDGDRLIKGMLKNRDILSEQGIVAPAPTRYRTMIRETMQALNNARPNDDAQQALFDDLVEDEGATRLLLSNEHFICVQQKVLEHGTLYARAGDKIAGLTNLFHGHEVEFFLAIANPATFLPTIAARVKNKSFAEWYGMTDASALLWSDVITRIRAANPSAPLTVWCNEDTPLIWPQVMREFAGVDHGTEFVGRYEVLAQIMKKEGMRRFKEYLETHPPVTEVHLRRIMAAFLDKYAIEDAIEVELDLPGWTEEDVDRLSDIYEEDVDLIARMPGVTFLAP